MERLISNNNSGLPIIDKIHGYTAFAGENILKALKPLLPSPYSVITPRDKRRYSPDYLIPRCLRKRT